MAETHRIGKYEILEELGRGGFATVYKARDTDLGRTVALKVLHAHWAGEQDFAVRFHNEARAAANLRHPNIVTVYEAGEAAGQLFIAMEYLPGRTLRDLLEVEGALSLEQALPILEQVADALDYAHAQGIVHRDVKPANIMVETTARGPRAVLTDFGLVKALESSAALTSQGTLLGSPEYMAPEQADPDRVAEIGPATDRYALGIVAYQMLAGRVPFLGNTPGTLNAHLNLEPPNPRRFVADLPPDVTTALLTMLAKAPADRFPTALAFVEQL
ncbi:MAG: serine/threonine-protein kinase, partial [Anaerolineae bacterium]